MRKLPDVPELSGFDNTAVRNRDEYTSGPYLIWADKNKPEAGWTAEVIIIGDSGQTYKKQKVSEGVKSPDTAIEMLRTFVRSDRAQQEGKTPEEMDLENKIISLEKELTNFVNSHSVRSSNHEFINCPVCRSGLKKKLLVSNKCPLCKSDLRARNVTDKIDRYQSELAELNKQLKNIRG
ncbi:MAG: hypothetical protein IK078_03245 [Lachnospiraceae bacterium]|nr:hypothetical protein [Lachnospiraceae bacterium]